MTLPGDREYLLALEGMGGLCEGRVAEEGVERCQPRVTSSYAVVPARLEVIEEQAEERGVEVLEVERRRGPAETLFREAEEQSEGVAVAGDGVLAGAELMNESICEEALEEAGEVGCAHPSRPG